MTDNPDPEAPPPIGRTWNRLYSFVIAFLIFQIALFFIFTKAFE